eukprot:Selendium_serpulae@DN6416_c1_g2_i3.p1
MLVSEHRPNAVLRTRKIKIIKRLTFSKDSNNFQRQLSNSVRSQHIVVARHKTTKRQSQFVEYDSLNTRQSSLVNASPHKSQTVSLSLGLSLCLFLCLSVCLCMSLCLTLCPSLCLSPFLSLCLFVSLSV